MAFFALSGEVKVKVMIKKIDINKVAFFALSGEVCIVESLPSIVIIALSMRRKLSEHTRPIDNNMQR